MDGAGALASQLGKRLIGSLNARIKATSGPGRSWRLGAAPTDLPCPGARPQKRAGGKNDLALSPACNFPP